MKGKVLAIIPAYNEEENIQWVVEELQRKAPFIDYIVVNDGSKDDTVLICKNNKYPVLDLPVNLGLSAAVLSGMRFAVERGYDMAVQYDGDGQHCPEYIEILADAVSEGGADVAIGSRFKEKEKPVTARMIGSRLISFCILFTTGKRLTDPTSGMRMYSNKIMKVFISNPNYRPEPDTISYLLYSGMKVTECQVEMRERVAGHSYLSVFSSIRYMIQMVFSILLTQGIRGKGNEL